MKTALLCAASLLITTFSTHAIDDFNVQMSKILHEDLSLSHDIYTTGEPAGLWKSECPWFQKPAAGVRFNATHQERIMGFGTEAELFSPMVDLNFQTVGGVNIGLVYSHGFASEEDVFFGTVGKVLIEGDLDSGGGYVAKQFDCGFKLGATWAYSAGELRLKDAHRPFSEFDTFGASGALGFARSFGDKKNWRNAFVDTSANFLFQSEEDAWSFLWMAKVGHNCCERFAVYGLFNLYHKLDYRGRFVVSPVFAGYRPYGDDTWGETGGGFQARLWRGLTFTAEATTPVLDEGLIASNAFQVRAAFHWRF